MKKRPISGLRARAVLMVITVTEAITDILKGHLVGDSLRLQAGAMVGGIHKWGILKIVGAS